MFEGLIWHWDASEYVEIKGSKQTGFIYEGTDSRENTPRPFYSAVHFGAEEENTFEIGMRFFFFYKAHADTCLGHLCDLTAAFYARAEPLLFVCWMRERQSRPRGDSCRNAHQRNAK